MMVRAVVSPTVPQGTERVRICLHAGNTVKEVESLVSALQAWCEKSPENMGIESRSPERIRARL
jgi:8-amino-7-oxononanoate synthase